jgi:hypothetical protein
MSTPEKIAARLAELSGVHLVQLPALVSDPLPNRIMWVTEDVYDSVQPPFSEDYDGERLWRFRGSLDAFTNHYKISVAEDPFYKASDVFLARVHEVAEEFWDIRTMEPPSGIRCFGCFAGADEFVALTWNYRENIGNFNEAVRECMGVWNNLFGSLTPHSGDSLDAYLSNYWPV